MGVWLCVKPRTCTHDAPPTASSSSSSSSPSSSSLPSPSPSTNSGPSQLPSSTAYMCVRACVWRIVRKGVDGGRGRSSPLLSAADQEPHHGACGGHRRCARAVHQHRDDPLLKHHLRSHSCLWVHACKEGEHACARVPRAHRIRLPHGHASFSAADPFSPPTPPLPCHHAPSPPPAQNRRTPASCAARTRSAPPALFFVCKRRKGGGDPWSTAMHVSHGVL